jgi:hypothetical protein
MCVSLDEACDLFRFCPPQPVPEYHSILKSRSFQETLGVSCGSITATVTVDVWTRPLRSVGGTRWILCPPASFISWERSVPVTTIETPESPLSAY